MYFGRGSLKSVLKRYVLITGPYNETASYAELTEIKEEPVSGKPGVIRLTYQGDIITDFMCHLVFHPSLYLNGEVSGPTILAPGSHTVEILYRPIKKEFDTSSLTYFARLYVDDTPNLGV